MGLIPPLNNVKKTDDLVPEVVPKPRLSISFNVCNVKNVQNMKKKNGHVKVLKMTGETPEVRSNKRKPKRLPSRLPTSGLATWWAILRWAILSTWVIRIAHLNHYVFLHNLSVIWALGKC